MVSSPKDVQQQKEGKKPPKEAKDNQEQVEKQIKSSNNCQESSNEKNITRTEEQKRMGKIQTCELYLII